jgi:type I restriction enzyme, S subunit
MKSEKLGTIVTIAKGRKHNLIDAPTEHSTRVLQIDDLRNDSLIKFTDDRNGVCANDDDILIVWDGANAGTVGYGKKGFIGSTIALLRKNQPDKYVSGFIGTFLQSKFTYLRSNTIGAAIPHISRDVLESLKLPVFDRSDQIRIATVLSKADALIAKRKESLGLIAELLKSIFLEMFGDPAVNPKRFELSNLSDFYINPAEGTKCGPFGSALKKSEYSSSGIPVWTMDNISKDGCFIEEGCLWISEAKYKTLATYSVRNGDVIISRAGTVGKMCVVNSRHPVSIISTNLIRVRFGTGLLPIYFVSLMTYSKGRVGRLRTGPDGAFTHMNTGILDSLKIPYPPMPLQTKFAQIVETVETLKAHYRASLKELENLYGSLSQQAFKGELDLSNVVIDHIVPRCIGGSDEAENLTITRREDNIGVADRKGSLIRVVVDEHFKDREFSFDELWQKLGEMVADDSLKYDEVKDMVFKALRGELDITLTQSFNAKSEKRQIMLRATS